MKVEGKWWEVARGGWSWVLLPKMCECCGGRSCSVEEEEKNEMKMAWALWVCVENKEK